MAEENERSNDIPEPSPAKQRGSRLSRRTFLGGAVVLVGAGAAGGIGASLLLGDDGDTDGTSVSGGVQMGSQSTGASQASILFPMPKGDRYAEAAHLLRRAGFGGTRAEISELAALNREGAVDRLMDFSVPDDVDQKLQEIGVDVWNNPRDLER